jgi:hypothetical protein
MSYRWLTLPVLALVTYGLTALLAVRPHLTERLYSNGLYPPLATGLSTISKIFPFSMGDLFYALLVVGFLTLVLLAIFRKISVGSLLKKSLNLAALVYILFYWLWGFNYFREPFNERLGIKKADADTDQFMAVFEDLIEKANTYQTKALGNLNLAEADSLIEKVYSDYADFLKIRHPQGSRRAKNITFSKFFAKAGISGYYGPFFNEIHINPHLHPLELPVVLAHEKAHQFGITSEAEASFYAWFACEYSGSDDLRYSNSLYLLRYFLNQGYQLEGFDERVAKLSEPVRNDLRAIRDHWLAMRNEKIDKAASRANDAYLKTNKVTAGIADYKGIVAMVMDFRTDSLLQSKIQQQGLKE